MTELLSSPPMPLARAIRIRFITCGAIMPGTPSSSASSSASRRSLCARSSAKLAWKSPLNAFSEMLRNAEELPLALLITDASHRADHQRLGRRGGVAERQHVVDQLGDGAH